jgi:hypothetical protein
MIAGLSQYGLVNARVVARFDCFRGTSKEKTARKFGVHGMNAFACKSA